MRRVLLPAVLCVTGACVPPPPRVSVVPAGPGIALAPRAPDCEIELFRTRPPERPYDEVGALHFEARIGDGPEVAQEELRREACALGADAIVVTRDWTGGVMSGTAVSYRDMREKHRAEARLRPSTLEREARLEEDRRTLAAQRAAAGAAGPPADFVAGRAREDVWPRASPERRAPELDELRAGTPVWIAPAPFSGWRRVWRPGVTSAWVEEGTVELLPPATAPSPAGRDAPKPAGGT